MLCSLNLQQTLHQLCCLSEIPAEAELSVQAVIRGVCAIIDAFSFSVPSPPGEADHSAAPTASDGNVNQVTVDTASDAAAADQVAVEAAEQQLDIQSALTRRVLPSLRSQLIHNGEVRLSFRKCKPCRLHDSCIICALEFTQQAI